MHRFDFKNFVSLPVYATALSGALNKFITFTVIFLALLFTPYLQSIPSTPECSHLYIGWLNQQSYTASFCGGGGSRTHVLTKIINSQWTCANIQKKRYISISLLISLLFKLRKNYYCKCSCFIYNKSNHFFNISKVSGIAPFTETLSQ